MSDFFDKGDLLGNSGDGLGPDFKTYQELHDQNVRDPLTGSYNRRFLEESIDVLVSNKTPFTAIMLDVDHFKQKNDNYGHQAGDVILKEFNRTLEEGTRQYDGTIVARYGGEEFMIIIPGLNDKSIAILRAEDIRKRIESSRYRISDKDELKITASIGVGVWDALSSKEDFIESVDHALYQAKKNGRNRFEVAK